MARKVDHEQRKMEIARQAMHLFSKVGYDNVSLIMIAAASGISRTVLYRYFCSKREVLDAAILYVTGTIDRKSREILISHEAAARKIERICHVVAEVMFENKEFLIAVFDFVVAMVRTGADMNASIREFTTGTRNTLKTLIRHAIRRGEIPHQLDVHRMADALYAEFESCALRIVIGTEHDARAAKVRFSDAIRAIYCSPSPSPSLGS